MTRARGSAPAPENARVLNVCFWCVVAVVTEIGLFASYRGHDARFHWFTHFLVGSSAALLVMTAVTVRTRRPVPVPLVWALVGHLFAMIPDFAFAAGAAHRPWMDLFAGHLLALRSGSQPDLVCGVPRLPRRLSGCGRPVATHPSHR